jgi:hypothetical protein
MAAYRETDLIAYLMSVGCEFAGDTYVNGSCCRSPTRSMA